MPNNEDELDLLYRMGRLVDYENVLKGDNKLSVDTFVYEDNNDESETILIRHTVVKDADDRFSVVEEELNLDGLFDNLEDV